MASNFSELRSRWENCSVSKNISAFKNGPENSPVLKNGSCASLQHDVSFDTMYTSRLLLSRGLENRPVESRTQDSVSEKSAIQKTTKETENIPRTIREVKNGFLGSRIVEKASPVFSRVDSPDSGEAADVFHESDKEEGELILESDPEENQSKNDSTMENDLSTEFLEQEISFRPENRLSEFGDSFSEHLRELESSLKFDSPEKWLFASMEKRNSGTFGTSFEELSSCQSEGEDENSDEFVVRYESDSSVEAEQHSNTGKTLLPNEKFLSELNERYSANLVECQGSDKIFSIVESSSNKEDIEEKVHDNFSDSVSFDLPFEDFSDNLLSRLLPKEPCRRSSSSSNPKLSRSDQKSTQFQMTSKVMATDRINNGKIVSKHHRTSSLIVPRSSVEASQIRDSSWMTDLPQVASSTRMTDLTHVTSASQVSNMPQVTGSSWTTASTQMTDLTWMTDMTRIIGSSQVTDSMRVKVQTESTDEELKRSKMAVRRGKVIKEILDTEVTYQTHLALVIKFFERPLRVLNILSDHIVVTIFGNIEQLMAVNTELLIHLKSLTIGEAFRRLGPFLKLYSTYANNHERALAALMDWDQKSPEFAKFRRTQEDHLEMRGLKLNALLITPVQRIPRYKLLLEELLTCTPPDHEDYANIEEAVKQMSAVANHINEHIKQQDNFMKMLAIQRSLTGPLGPKILIPGRIFIKEGPLRKVLKKGGRSHERMFYLFSDILMYAKPRLLDGTPGCHTFMCCCILPLHHCKVNQVFGHSQGQGSLFTVQCKEESLLLFSDQKTVNSWISALQSAIDEVQASRQSLRKTSSAKEPMRGGAIVQFLKREKKTDPLIIKNNRPCEVSKHRTKKQQKNHLDEIKPCLDDHENIHPNESATDSTQKKHLLGFGCLRKRRRQIFSELASFTSPKSPSCPKDMHCPTDHRFASSDLSRLQSGTRLPTSRGQNRVGVNQSRPAAATSVSSAEESRMANSSIDSDVVDKAVLLPQRRHRKP